MWNFDDMNILAFPLILPSGLAGKVLLIERNKLQQVAEKMIAAKEDPAKEEDDAKQDAAKEDPAKAVCCVTLPSEAGLRGDQCNCKKVIVAN
eukprot:s4289_g4.t1